MGTRFLIDTNALIEFQEKRLPLKSQDFIASVIDNEFNISIVNQIEILGNRYVTKETENFIGLARVYDLAQKIVKTTIELRKVHRIKLPDALIAATAISYGFVLVTHNIKDFKNIGALNVRDSHQLQD